MDSLITLKNVSKHYGQGHQRTDVLKEINLDIREGEFVAIVGYSGAGKTTLISLIAGLLKPSSGQVLQKGDPITEPDPSRALVFQNYSLLPWLNVWDNISLAVNQVFPAWTNQKRKEHIQRYIEMVNLAPAIQKRPSELSGGMRQRVALARALAMDPSVLLLDEPLGALDALTRANLQEEIARIWSENKKTVILITNDVDEGIMLADRVIPLTRGPGATLGPSIQVNLARPRNRKTLNHDEAFKLLRQRVIDFLMKKSHSKHTATIRKTFVLPNILPDDLDAPRTFQFGKSNSVRREELKHERLEVEI